MRVVAGSVHDFLWVVFFPVLFCSSCFSRLNSDDNLPVDGDFDASFDVEISNVRNVTIATFNVEKFDLGGEGKGQYNAVAEFARDFEIDVLVLQEIQNDSRGDDETIFSSVLETESYPMPYRAMTSMSDGFNAIGVWSRFSLSNSEEILRENTRTVLVVDVHVDEYVFRLFSCHLKAGGDLEETDQRMTEAARLESFILNSTAPESMDLVLLGDMNTGTDADFAPGGTLDRLSLRSNNEQTSLDDFWPVNYSLMPELSTFPSSGAVFDHILLSRTAVDLLVPESVMVPSIAGDGFFEPSDHRPVLLQLSF